MGAVKKVFKGIGSLFGIGSSSTPSVQQVTPDPTPTTVNEVSGDTSGNTADAKKKKRRGFASTSTSLIGDAASTNKDTLG